MDISIYPMLFDYYMLLLGIVGQIALVIYETFPPFCQKWSLVEEIILNVCYIKIHSGVSIDLCERRQEPKLTLVGFEPTDQSQANGSGWTVADAHMPQQINPFWMGSGCEKWCIYLFRNVQRLIMKMSLRSHTLHTLSFPKHEIPFVYQNPENFPLSAGDQL